MGKIIVAGIGPGSKEDITPAVLDAVQQADCIVGYKYYFQFVEPYVKEGCECIDTGMKRERERAEQAFRLAEQGKTVVVISSGDAGIYGMGPLIYEMQHERCSVDGDSVAVSIEVLPGISAFQKAASLLGAPIGHDLCIISLSDLMTPWELIERRIKAAASGDFVTAIYNPKSHGRYWQLYRLVELFLQVRSPETPVGYVRQAGRDDQEIMVTTLAQFDPEDIDMFTVVLIGNSQSYIADGKIITPRGYNLTSHPSPLTTEKPGQQIMMESFRTIKSELKRQDYPIDHLWALLHAIHTTADFDMQRILYTDASAVETLYNKVKNGTLKTIITDVTMVTSGIRKGALQRLGIEAKCYLGDPRVAEMTAQQSLTSHPSPLTSEKITRTQAGIRLAVEEHPDALFAFGNAPTALMELCDLIRKGKARPAGIIAAPVGFVHVRESKHMVKPFKNIPKIIIEGRKGGSNLAATQCNAILTFDDAEQLKPGRDL